MAIVMDYTDEDFVTAIEREIAKRSSAYPRILQKMVKQGRDEQEVKETEQAQIVQMYHLQNAYFALKNDFIPTEDAVFNGIVTELKRELKMRSKCYPRFVWYHSKGRGGISNETALAEMAVWKALTLHFQLYHLPH